MTLRKALALCAAAGMLGTCVPALAQFSLAVSPPRFELTGKPGGTLREVLELTHTDSRPGSYRIKTADWTLRADGGVEFSDELLPGSCRPWVAIERREVTITPGRPYRYRFEITPPPETAPTECRFAIMIEGQEQVASANMPLGLAARIGVIVYAAVGDVAPQLSLVGTAVSTVDNRELPTLRVRNSGTAHGRLAGFLNGTDAGGTRLEFQPGTTPIMPGETRDIALVATKPGDAESQVTVRYPVTVSGQVEWGRAGSFKLDHRFAR